MQTQECLHRGSLYLLTNLNKLFQTNKSTFKKKVRLLYSFLNISKCTFNDAVP